MAAYQVLIVGAGFSGAETAFWLAQKGVRVGLLEHLRFGLPLTLFSLALLYLGLA